MSDNLRGTKSPTVTLLRRVLAAAVILLLTTTVFAGAGAAADIEIGTLFYFEKATNPAMDGTWTYGQYSFTIDTTDPSRNFVADTRLPTGKYKKGDCYILLKNPMATVTLIATLNGQNYVVDNGGILFQGSVFNTFSAKAPGIAQPSSYLVIGPEYVTKKVDTLDAGDYSKPGKYQIGAIFDKADFATGAPTDALESGVLFTFTVLNANDLTIKAYVESVNVGDSIRVTIDNGEPGKDYTVKANKFNFTSLGTVPAGTGSPSLPSSTVIIRMPNTGKADIYAEALSSGEGKVSVRRADGIGDEKTVLISILDETITAESYKDYYYIGDDVQIRVASNAGHTVAAAIEGIDTPFTIIKNDIVVDSYTKIVNIPGDIFAGMKLNAGVYTIYLGFNYTATDKESFIDKMYTTLPIALKQPSITIINAPAVVVMGNNCIVQVVADTASLFQHYVFGDNFFISGFSDGTIQIQKEVTRQMDAGRYFLVIQHPMYDKVLNIRVDKQKDVYLYDSNGAKITPPLFNLNDPEITNAAQALCDAIDTHDIDDIYAITSFVVAEPTSSINPIPTEITKGSKLTVSGTTNMGEGKLVTVSILSTAYSEKPKETVGPASYLWFATKTDIRGNWEVAFDTSGLNVDEYNISVFVDGLDEVTSKLNVIDGVPVPITPTSYLTLHSGWNFISIPKTLNASCDMAGKVFSNVDTGGTSILGYDAKTGWYTLSRDSPIKPLDAYWIYSVAEVTVPLKYEDNQKSRPATKQLYQGWNAVGISSNYIISAKTAFADLNWLRYIPWNVEAQDWGRTLVLGGSARDSEENDVSLGNGAWLYMKADGTYTGNAV